jgi:hypothetical protein
MVKRRSGRRRNERKIEVDKANGRVHQKKREQGAGSFRRATAA